MPPVTQVGCVMLKPRSLMTRACFPHSVQTQENFPVSTGIVQLWDNREEKLQKRGESSTRSDATGTEKRAWIFSSTFNFFQENLMIKRTNLLFLFTSDLLQKPLWSLSPLFIAVLRVSFFPPNYNFSILRGQERIQFKRKTVELFQSKQ